MSEAKFNFDAVVSVADKMKAAGWLKDYWFVGTDFRATATELGRDRIDTIHVNLNEPAKLVGDACVSITRLGNVLEELFGDDNTSLASISGLRWIAKAVTDNSVDNRPRQS